MYANTLYSTTELMSNELKTYEFLSHAVIRFMIQKSYNSVLW